MEVDNHAVGRTCRQHMGEDLDWWHMVKGNG